MFFILLAAATISRFLPHPANLTPIGAIAIFAASRLGLKRGAMIALMTMIISDIFIGFNFASIAVYVGMLAYVLSSRLIKIKYIGYLLAPLSGSVVFFLITNFAVWLGPWYEHSLAGLIKCFTLAIPFYRNTLIGDIVFTAAIFGIVFVEKKYKFVPLRSLTRRATEGLPELRR